MKKRNQTPFNREARERRKEDRKKRMLDSRDPQKATRSGLIFVAGVIFLFVMYYFKG